jgi:hypothetical protein
LYLQTRRIWENKLYNVNQISWQKKGRHLDTIEKLYIYQETKNNNQINDRVIYNKIFEIILENRKES